MFRSKFVDKSNKNKIIHIHNPCLVFLHNLVFLQTLIHIYYNILPYIRTRENTKVIAPKGKIEQHNFQYIKASESLDSPYESLDYFL